MKTNLTRTQKWEKCKQTVEGIVTALQARGACFYRYCNYGVYVYLDHTLFNLESKTKAYELLCWALGMQQIPDRKRIYSIFYQRIDGLAIEIPRDLGDVSGAWRSEKIDRFVKTVIESRKIQGE